jgi:hypothetical protein
MGMPLFTSPLPRGNKVITDSCEPGACGGGIPCGPIPDEADIVRELSLTMKKPGGCSRGYNVIFTFFFLQS